MTPSDPKRAKEITTPRSNISSPPPEKAEKEKKADKKLDPTVVVAIISAVVTLLTALLSSPVLLTLVNKDPTEVSSQAPSGAEMGMSGLSGTLLPGVAQNTPMEGLTKAILTPSQIPSVEITTSPTNEQHNEPEAPTATVSIPGLASATDLPPPPENTAEPTLAAPSLLSCFTLDIWFPYPSTLNPGVTDGCWNLADWGFSMDQGQLFLVHNPAVDQQRGVYLPLSGDVVIQFTLQMNEFRMHTNKGGFLHFGIVQDDPFSNYSGGYLSYQQPTPGATSPVRVLVSGTNQATQTLLILEKGFQQAIMLSIEGDLLTVFIDGTPVGKPVNLPLTDRAFWIGYVLPAKAELDVHLTGLVVQTP